MDDKGLPVGKMTQNAEKIVNIESNDNLHVDTAFIKINQPDRNPGNGFVAFIHKHRNKIIIIAAISIVSIMLSILLIERMTEYNKLTRSAKTAYNSGNYEKASELYQDAANAAITTAQYEKAICHAADSHLCLGMTLDSDDDFVIAARLYDKIIEDTRNHTDGFYADALSGICIVYDHTGHILNDDWGRLIDALGSHAKKLKKIDTDADLKDIDDIQLQRWQKIHLAFWEYYYAAIKADYSFMQNPYITKLALENFIV